MGVWGHRWIVAGDDGERDNRTGHPAVGIPLPGPRSGALGAYCCSFLVGGRYGPP